MKIKLLETPLDDYRKTIVNLILAPYLSNVQWQLDYESSLIIIKRWLESCGAKRKLDFDVDYLIGNALRNAKNSGYRPMRLDTLRTRNSGIYEILGLT